MITLIDDRNKKNINIHHKSSDRFEITIGKEQLVLSESQIKTMADKITDYIKKEG